MSEGRPATYAAAGVDLDAAEAAVERLKHHVARTARAEVNGDIGGFGGLFAFDARRWRAPLLVSATDGVGTKLELARRLGRHRSVGIDLVAMVVDDIVVAGAEPLFFLDYLAVGALHPQHVEAVVAGIADGCVQAGCALIGGETAEHPGVMAADAYDLAGFGVGVVERDRLLGPHRVQPGDAVVALASSGLHSNGFSLVRALVDGLDLQASHGLHAPLGEVLLTPTRIYTRDCLALADAVDVHAFCHVTGGGIPGNLPRVLPAGLGAVIDTGAVPVPGVFRFLQRRGDVPEAEMWRTFNMGAGMLAVLGEPEQALALLNERGVPAWVCGRVTTTGQVVLSGVAQQD